MRIIFDYNPTTKRLSFSSKTNGQRDWSYCAISCTRSEWDRIYSVCYSLFRSAHCPPDVMELPIFD